MNFYTPNEYTQAQLELLDNDEVVYPYSDEYAIYLGKKHQYELTRKYFEERGINLEKEESLGTGANRVQIFLTYLRIKFYNYMYSHSKSPRRVINYMIAKRGINGFEMYEYREDFLEAMFLEGEYLLKNGDISQFNGVDIDTMQNMNIDVIKSQDRDFSLDAKRKLVQLGLNFYGQYRFIIQDEEW